MSVIQFESVVEDNLIRVPEEYIDSIHSGTRVIVRPYNDQKHHSESVIARRTGFLKDKITIPKDFDRMCEAEIEEMFGANK